MAQGIASIQGSDTVGASPIAWEVDANIGALRLEGSDFQAAGDLTFGIGQDNWGVVAWGSGSAYEIDNDEVLTDTTKLEGTGDGWFTSGDEDDPFRFVLRASGGGVNYSSTVTRKAGSGSYVDDTSWMGRGALLIGAVLQPSSLFSAYLAVGGGFQFEWYDTTTAGVGTATSTATIDDNQDLSLLGSARFDASWIIARDIVSFRVRSLATYFRLTRDNDFLGAGNGAVVAQSTSTTFTQLEVNSRGFIDVDVASFFGFRPTVHGGLDYIRISGDGETQSTSIPVFGAGLLRPWM